MIPDKVQNKLKFVALNLKKYFKAAVIAWNRLTRSQKISFIFLVAVILIIPLTLVLVAKPTEWFSKAEVATPATPPTTLYSRKTEGDSDNDGIITTTDFSIWLNEYRTTHSGGTTPTPTLFQADFDGDLSVTTTDFSIWLNGYWKDHTP